MSKSRLDLMLPVYNEEAELEEHSRQVHNFMSAQMDNYDWRIVIVSNASTDQTVPIGKRLADELERLSLMDLDVKGRGRALRRAWMRSDADILSYMDIDLSADLAHYPELIGAIRDGHDIAIGSRLASDSRVTRGCKREFISRSYNFLIKSLFRTHFSDAQCGFKAVSRKVVDDIMPLVEDNHWFFDSELLIIAEKAGYSIYDLPISWVDDPGSTVKIIKTARGDIEGLIRLWFTRPWKQIDGFQDA